MDCQDKRRTAKLISLCTKENVKSGHDVDHDLVNHEQRKLGSLHFDRQGDPIVGTLVALDRRLEMIRKEQLAKNRANLCQLDLEQLQALEWVTTNITRKIFREVADELEHSESEGNGKRLSETICLMLGLA